MTPMWSGEDKLILAFAKDGKIARAMDDLTVASAANGKVVDEVSFTRFPEDTSMRIEVTSNGAPLVPGTELATGQVIKFKAVDIPPKGVHRVRVILSTGGA